jgi:hypothetical protein
MYRHRYWTFFNLVIALTGVGIGLRLAGSIARLERRLDALERRAAVTVQRVDIHVERAADAPVVADGLLRHTLPGFARVKRLATAKDLQP